MERIRKALEQAGRDRAQSPGDVPASGGTAEVGITIDELMKREGKL